MTWTDPQQLKKQLMRLWERGELLRDAVTGRERFPLRLALKTPNSADITNHFEAVRAWATELASTKFVRVEWQALRHHVQGTQNLPACVWVETLEDALNCLGKRKDWNCFIEQVSVTRQTHPALLPWLEKRPLQALALSADWPRLLSVVTWLAEHPRPGIYLRQVDLPNVHSKFIENHRGVLTELLDLTLPVNVVDVRKTGISQFAARYGFLEKPTRIRFRVLDPRICILPGLSSPDVTLDADSFSRLDLAVQRIFITENETNFLVFPPMHHAIVIFGAGYGWDALARSHWLNNCAIHYWGDIDTHGFGILDQLRGHFDHVDSFLMDRATLDAHAALWGCEDKPLRIDLHRLTSAEQSLYDDLRDAHIRPGLRLEQEHIGFQWLTDHLQQLDEMTTPNPGISPDQY
ncbi:MULTISPECIES: DUF3322 domain-containing protein [Acidithiobacillus]|uniref:Wadjet protein JetD C-terminal domain-containing protein n=1 Tax=Acidithiobacillus thiooxidans ATCC 19377 TaxID=637390 RepID=A0A5P9XN81_ACITH|nr:MULTISPECIES: DUF3322 domain-containing protein [Acidithiobacillus]MBU2742084.1 hypothetical protein [Acidithiobacillus albertensis]MBU2751996.1 hypothetical protein [Acidithiobacillus thiooxidans]MBU2792823.1 hypothetical protein [Acidithiobacillus thiooxidans]MBU2837186.1 hypothetical protein [Acidithiobacillus thiooxidans]QFX95352.1 hypothetical protein GCD22_00909 [Acidithiobacillus thiooxidans ATCC 19377]